MGAPQYGPPSFWNSPYKDHCVETCPGTSFESERRQLFTMREGASKHVGNQSLPGTPVACNLGLRSINCGLLWGIVASYFGLLGFPGRQRKPTQTNRDYLGPSGTFRDYLCPLGPIRLLRLPLVRLIWNIEFQVFRSLRVKHAALNRCLL